VIPITPEGNTLSVIVVFVTPDNTRLAASDEVMREFEITISDPETRDRAVPVGARISRLSKFT